MLTDPSWSFISFIFSCCPNDSDLELLSCYDLNVNVPHGSFPGGEAALGDIILQDMKPREMGPGNSGLGICSPWLLPGKFFPDYQ